MAVVPSPSPIILIQDGSSWTHPLSCLYFVTMYSMIFQHGVWTSLWFLNWFPNALKVCFRMTFGHLAHFSCDLLSFQWKLIHVSFFVRDSEVLRSSAIPLRPPFCHVSRVYCTSGVIKSSSVFIFPSSNTNSWFSISTLNVKHFNIGP